MTAPLCECARGRVTHEQRTEDGKVLRAMCAKCAQECEAGTALVALPQEQGDGTTREFREG